MTETHPLPAASPTRLPQLSNRIGTNRVSLPRKPVRGNNAALSSILAPKAKQRIIQSDNDDSENDEYEADGSARAGNCVASDSSPLTKKSTGRAHIVNESVPLNRIRRTRSDMAAAAVEKPGTLRLGAKKTATSLPQIAQNLRGAKANVLASKKAAVGKQVLPPGWDVVVAEDGQVSYMDANRGIKVTENPTLKQPKIPVDVSKTPLPRNWEERMYDRGIPYYLDHNRKTTTWIDPRISHVLLPSNWEIRITEEGVPYYVDHSNKATSWLDPRKLWDDQLASKNGEPDAKNQSPLENFITPEACEIIKKTFCVKDEIGRGGYGKIILVQKKGEQKTSVLKIVSLSMIKPGDQMNAFREVEVHKQLSHPNIVEFYDGIADSSLGFVWIEMQLCTNGDMFAYLQKQIHKKQYLEEKDVLSFFVQILKALKYMHQLGYIHRDLKSANIFLDERKSVRLGDFGMTRHLSLLQSPDWDVDADDAFVGTPQYMSPEIISNKFHRYDEKTDIWSAGVLLYEFAALRVPFEGNNMQQILDNVVKTSYESIPKHYSNDLKDLVRLILRKKPSLRPDMNRIFSSPIVSAHAERK